MPGRNRFVCMSKEQESVKRLQGGAEGVMKIMKEINMPGLIVIEPDGRGKFLLILIDGAGKQAGRPVGGTENEVEAILMGMTLAFSLIIVRDR